jgi:hypothetical protein
MKNQKIKLRMLCAAMLLALGILGTITFIACSNDDEKEGEKQELKSSVNEVNIPDGTYIGYLGDIIIENTFKNHVLIRRVVNGEDVEIQNAPQQKVFDTLEDALAYVKALDNNGCPCISQYSITANWGTTYIVEYDGLDNNGNCWYDQYR